jgi:RNA polymerase sigma-70 factor, ECF subfamily
MTLKRSIRALAERFLRLPYEELSRGQLLTRYVRCADARAFEALLRRCTPLVQSRCRVFLDDRSEAEEAAAEVLALLAVKAATIRDPEQLDSWLCRTAHNVARNRNRRAARRRAMEQPLQPDDVNRPELVCGPRPDVEAELRERYRQVLAEMARLSETLRRTLEAVQQTDSYHEAAEVLGCSLAKVKQDVSRARRALRQRLREKGVVVPAALAALLLGAQESAAWVGWSGVARWLIGRWALGAALVVAGLGTVLLVGGVSPSASDEPSVAPAAVPGTPVAALGETLQEKNLRIFRSEVLPKLTPALRQLGGDFHLVDLRAEGSEVLWFLEGTRPFFGCSKAPRARGRYCVLARDFYSELDLAGTGDWTGAGADRIVIRSELFGRKSELTLPIDRLGIRSAFDLLPPDERALDEFNNHLRHEPVADATELVLPGLGWWGVAGNSRYLYVVSVSGLLLAHDSRGSFPGWQCIGGCERQTEGLAANDELLFRVRQDGQMVARCAELAVHDWRPMGPVLSGGGPLCASRDALFCVKDDFTLWSRPIDGHDSTWRQVGTAPGGQKLATVGDRLYCLNTRDGLPELWSRPLAADDGAWERMGDYPPLKCTSGWLNQLRLEAWNGELLAWAMSDERLFARAAGSQPQPWRQVGRKDLEFLRRW